MRLQEWVVWSFPEAIKIISNHEDYAAVMTVIGGDKQLLKSEEVTKQLAEVVSPTSVDALKAAASISMGTDITPLDRERIMALAQQIK